MYWIGAILSAIQISSGFSLKMELKIATLNLFLGLEQKNDVENLI